MDIFTALESISEEEMDRFRVVSWPVWLEAGKKGQTFGAFLKAIGLGYTATRGGNPPKRPSKERIAEIYVIADRIRAKDKG